MVGLAFSRSICESMDFDTPAVRDKSSKVKPLSSRKRCRVAPTSGGAAGAAELALVVATFAITFFS